MAQFIFFKFYYIHKIAKKLMNYTIQGWQDKITYSCNILFNEK